MELSRMDSDIKAVKEALKNKKRRQEALLQFRRGMDLYEQGWTAERKNQQDQKKNKSHPQPTPIILTLSKRASAHFFGSVQKFEKAFNLHANDPEIIRYYRLAVRKVRGNESLERGLICQRQAIRAECIQRDHRFAILRYQDAIDDYECARKHFEKGRRQDGRFDNYLQIVVEGLQTVISNKIRLITSMTKNGTVVWNSCPAIENS